jgi:hypothetical protein
MARRDGLIYAVISEVILLHATLLTGLSQDRRTVPLVLRGLVAGRAVDIADEEMQSAVAPNHLMPRERIEIDLTSIPDFPSQDYWTLAARAIDEKVERLHALEPNPGRTVRISVFALAPIPLLVHLGSRLSDKMLVDLYQRHRDPESWTWRDGPGAARFITRQLVDGGVGAQVALLVNLSGRNSSASIQDMVGGRVTVYELTLDGQDPDPLSLNTLEDLGRFKEAYIRLLATIRQEHPDLEIIHLFPAVPAPVAVTIGRSRLPKVDAPMRVYDRDVRAGGFAPTLTIQ